MSRPGKRRIAVVGLTHPFRGGIAHYTTLLCRALAARHDVRLFSLTRQYPALLFLGKTQYDDSTATLDFAHEPCLDSINPLSWLRTYLRIRRYRPDFLLLSWWNPFFAPCFGTVARLCRRSGIRSAFICHNVIPHEPSLLDRGLLRYAFGSSNLFITHSRKDRDDLRNLRADAHIRRHVHPTYEVFTSEGAPTREHARAKLGLPDRRVLLFFGFVREYKGLDVLLEAMALGSDPRYHLLVVGEFYESRERYEPRLGRLLAEGKLTLVDRYVPNEEVALYFAASDLLIVPYRTATQSGVVQIAYGFGLPVVATRVGGIPEVVVDGETGYLVPPDDAPAMASAVRGHFERDESARVAENIAREREKYSWDRMVTVIEELIAGSEDASARSEREKGRSR